MRDRKIIVIHYADNETGSAEILRDRLARVASDPLTDKFCRDALVWLDRDPDDPHGTPRIAEVIHVGNRGTQLAGRE